MNSKYLFVIALFSCIIFHKTIENAGTPKSKPSLDLWFESAKSGDLETIKKMSHVIDVNSKDSHGWTALMWATDKNHENIVQFLLQAPNINVNFKDKLFHKSALLIASWRGYARILKLLLQNPNIDVNIQDSSEWTALMYAVYYDHINCVKLLLQAPNINLVIENISDQTALQLAEFKKNSKIINLLDQTIKILAKKAFEAARGGDIKKVRSIIKQIGYDCIVDEEGNSLVHYAFSHNNCTLALSLLKMARDPRILLASTNQNGETPLELVNPTSPLFELCMDMAFASKNESPTCFKRKIVVFFDKILNPKKITSPATGS